LAQSRKMRQKDMTETGVIAAGRSDVSVMVVISIVFVIFAAAYNYLTPLVTPVQLHQMDGGAANPDEPAHLLYTAMIASGHLPVFSQSSPGYEAHQPPLYYLLAAVVYKFAPPNATVRAHDVRWVATLIGLALVWVTFIVVREQFSRTEYLAVTTALVVALIPMNVALSASVSNDTATNLIIALFLLQLGRLLRSGDANNQQSLVLGVVLAAGIWTKSSTLILFPVLMVALGIAAQQNLLTPKQAARCIIKSTVATLVVASPWLVRNYHFYGDVFAQNVIFHDLAARNVAPSSLIHTLGLMWYLRTFFAWTFASFWGVFDSMNLFMPASIYIVIAALSIVGLLVGALRIGAAAGSKPNQVVGAAWLSLIVLTVVGYIQYNSHFFQVQGRYLYPALIPLSTVGVYGILAITPKTYVKWAHYAVLIALVLVNLLCLSMISGRYSA
jgi:hypothetical protein